jgi:hypothetical protein
VSCSSNSTMPTEPNNLRGSVRSRASGDAVRGMLDRSLLLPLATLMGPGGLRPLKVPRARVTVLMPPSSPRVLLSILAAASELEKRGGRCGRGLRDEKKSGEGGCLLTWNCGALLGKWKGSSECSECRERVCRRRRLCSGSVAGVKALTMSLLLPLPLPLPSPSSVGVNGLFFPATAGGALTAPVEPPRPPTRLCRGPEKGREMESPRSRRTFVAHVGCRVGRGLDGCLGGVAGVDVSGGVCPRGFVAGGFAKMDGGWGKGIDQIESDQNRSDQTRKEMRRCYSVEGSNADQHARPCKALRIQSDAVVSSPASRRNDRTEAEQVLDESKASTLGQSARSAGQIDRRWG